MRIVKLEAENIKRLRCVSITPAGNVVQITGPNGSGKSSVLDAIWWALGGKDSIQSKPLRKGTERGQVKLDLGELVVTRVFRASGTTEVRVENKNGEKPPKSPQAILDSLVGRLTFDPLEFSRMAPREQLDTLRGIVKLDLDSLENKIVDLGNTRADQNKVLKSLKAQAEAITIPEGTPDQEVDVSALAERLNDAGLQALNIQKSRTEAARLRSQSLECSREIKRRKDLIEEHQREIALAEKRISHLIDAIGICKRDVEEITNEAVELIRRADELEAAIPAALNTQAIQDEIRASRAVNAAVDAKRTKSNLEKQAKDLAIKVEGISQEIKRNIESRQEAIAAAKMPVAGLEFGAGEVLWNGLPLNQASSAEQLRISTAIAIEMNPNLRVIRIQDGSLLDDNGMRLLEEMAEKRDMQIWIERCHASGPVAVVMEAGEVSEVSYAEANPA